MRGFSSSFPVSVPLAYVSLCLYHTVLITYGFCNLVQIIKCDVGRVKKLEKKNQNNYKTKILTLLGSQNTQAKVSVGGI